jgi:hypothetical protein
MHTERPTEANAIVILDMLKSLSKHGALTIQRALRSSGLNACCSAAFRHINSLVDMRRSSEPCQGLRGYILVTCYGGDQKYQHRKRDSENHIAPSRFFKTHACFKTHASRARRKRFRVSTGQLSPECHMSRRSFRLYTAVQLIFTPPAGHGYS